jgi:hypothetical protein
VPSAFLSLSSSSFCFSSAPIFFLSSVPVAAEADDSSRFSVFLVISSALCCWIFFSSFPVNSSVRFSFPSSIFFCSVFVFSSRFSTFSLLLAALFASSLLISVPAISSLLLFCFCSSALFFSSVATGAAPSSLLPSLLPSFFCISVSRFLFSCFSFLLVSIFSSAFLIEGLFCWLFSNSVSPLLVSVRRSATAAVAPPSGFSSVFFAAAPSSLFSFFFSREIAPAFSSVFDCCWFCPSILLFSSRLFSNFPTFSFATPAAAWDDSSAAIFFSSPVARFPSAVSSFLLWSTLLVATS